MRIDPDPAPDTAADYVERTNRAIDYVLRHLAEPLRLEDVAAVACFSPFHFHRVFRSVTGETLKQFVRRLRLERALYLLSHEDRTLTDVAHTCGFASSSDFSRSFKQRYGVSPSGFDVEAFRAQRRQELQDAITSPATRHLLDRMPKGSNPDGFEVELRDLPARTVAYIRVLEPFGGGVREAADRLVAWARARGFEGGQWLGYMWDDPNLVAHEDCRYDVGVVVDAPFETSGEVGRFEFPPMRVAHLTIRGEIDLEQRALDWLHDTWLPQSGYAPSEQPCFEAWHGLPFAHGDTWFEIDVQWPVVRRVTR